MKRIVITGSSRGIGYHMAKYFLDQGHMVVLSGSSDTSTEKAFHELSENHTDRVYSKACDVRAFDQVESLADYALSEMESIDIWINNAGISHTSQASYLISEDTARQVVDVNVHGIINGSKAAINIFKKQGFGALYNMEGLGSDGRIADGLSIYGGSKRFLRYYTRALSKEAKDQDYIVARTSPGMVTTDLLMKDIEKSANPEKTKKIFSILADHVTDVAPWLGQKILTNKKNGVLIAWLTTPKIIIRFLTSSFIKRDPFTK